MANTLEVEGYSTAEPIDDEDLRDVFHQIRGKIVDRKFHDRNGYLAHEAGGPECLALGHAPEDDEWDWDTHPMGWNGDQLCEATKYDVACSNCEGEVDDCEGFEDLVSPADFWKLVSA